MKSETPGHCHTRFRVPNVKLPFTGRGNFAFAGQAEHFFCVHQVHDATLIDAAPHRGGGYNPNNHSLQYDSGGVHQNENIWDTETPGSDSQHDTARGGTTPGGPLHHTNPNLPLAYIAALMIARRFPDIEICKRARCTVLFCLC